jgi:hypothetical protein
MNIEKHNGMAPIKTLASYFATQGTDPLPIIESSLLRQIILCPRYLYEKTQVHDGRIA